MAKSMSHEEAKDLAIPDALPESESLKWALLPPSKRTQALERLRAVVRVVEGETATAVAADMSIGRRNLATMVAHWRTEPGLKALRIQADSKKVRETKNDLSRGGWIEEKARLILESDLSLSNEAVTTMLAADPGGPVPTLNAVRSRVDRVRRDLRAIAGIFGRAIVVDTSAIEIAAAGQVPFRVAAVIDQETTILLGWAVGTASDGIGLSRFAAEDAVRRLRDIEVPGPIASSLEHFEIDAAGGDDGQDFIEFARLTQAAKPWPVRYQDGMRLGSHLLRAVGDRIGRFYIRRTWVRNPSEAKRKALQEIGLDDMIQLVEAEFDGHNASVLAKRTGRLSAKQLSSVRQSLKAMLQNAFSLPVA